MHPKSSSSAELSSDMKVLVINQGSQQLITYATAYHVPESHFTQSTQSVQTYSVAIIYIS